MKKKNFFLYKKYKSCKLRKKNRNFKLYRFVIFRTPKHIYANILSIDQKRIIVSASTNEKRIKNNLKKNNIYTGNKNSSIIIGKIIAIRSIKKGIKYVYLDRSYYKYHGRIKSLADNSKKYGLIF